MNIQYMFETNEELVVIMIRLTLIVLATKRIWDKFILDDFIKSCWNILTIST